MASSPTSGSTLTCPQCGYVNEAERVYCHNCGAKLDRSLLPKEDDVKTRESIERTRKRVKRMTNPSPFSLAREIKTLIGVLLWATVAAALIQFARKPDGVPPVQQELAARLVGSDLSDAIEAPQGRQVEFTEAEVNAHLKGLVKSRAGGLPGVRFERAYAKFEPGKVYIGMQQSLWGYHIYSGVAHSLSVRNGQLVTKNVGGNFGRLPVHPAIMEYADFAFKKLWAALHREQEQMERMQAIRVNKGSITLVTKPASQ